MTKILCQSCGDLLWGGVKLVKNLTLAFVPNFFAFLVRLAIEQAALLKVITYYGNNWAGKILKEAFNHFK